MRLPTDDQLSLREVCRDLLTAHSTSERVRRIAGSGTGHDGDLWKLTADLGWTALALPEEYGGLGGSACDLAVVAEEFGRVVQPSLLVQTLAVGRVLAAHGRSEPIRRLLADIGTGDAVVTWAVGEPGGQDGVTVRERDGTLRLTGHRDYVPDAAAATHAVLRAEGESGSRLVVVPLRLDAVSVRPMHTMDITRRYGRIVLDGAEIPDGLALPAGGSAADDLLCLGTVLQCAESNGIAARLLEMTVTYAGQRTQFGVPIGSFQALKHRIADMLIEVEAGRVATRAAAEAVDAGDGVPMAVSVAKSVVGRGTGFVATYALQLHGGIGFSWEHDLHLYLRRAKVNELLLGGPAWHEDRLATLLIPGEG
ncbi:acyl-CoA dehydrogenase family protein [Streptomyces sp. NPDC091292]|uniref:acyl-CoA dehydrogenase family protein n=1 Tax=Streptomyces sp. NPDC091292 TaxID=3365991 RepID=UPI00380A787C